MDQLDRRKALHVIAATASLSAVSPSTTAAQEPEKEDTGRRNGMSLKTPGSLQAEHEELHEELVRLTKAGGKTGDAAQAVAKVLHPHFVKEEELAMPPLGLLPAVAEGRLRPEMLKVTELTDRLKHELPAMLKEHDAIVSALDALDEAAQQENQPHGRQFAEKLKQHAVVEEEVLYPTAILVGEYIKLKLNN